jgi:hypothetical protein
MIGRGQHTGELGIYSSEGGVDSLLMVPESCEFAASTIVPNRKGAGGPKYNNYRESPPSRQAIVK